MMKTVGILLAGGESRRFGSPKAFAEKNGTYYYSYVFNAMTPFCDEIVISTRPELIRRFEQHEVTITDASPFQGHGPLTGIYTVMEAYPAERYIVLPCDMPYMSAEAVEQLLIHASPNVTVSAVQLKDTQLPLVSVWNYQMKELLLRQLEQGNLRVMSLFDQVQVNWIPGQQISRDETTFSNINHPADIERGQP